MEWFRGWFLTGFPWLSLGYSQTGTWMAGMAPVLGVYGVSALLLLGAGALVTLARGSRREQMLAGVVLLLVWVVPGSLQRHRLDPSVGSGHQRGHRAGRYTRG